MLSWCLTVGAVMGYLCGTCKLSQLQRSFGTEWAKRIIIHIEMEMMEKQIIIQAVKKYLAFM